MAQQIGCIRLLVSRQGVKFIEQRSLLFMRLRPNDFVHWQVLKFAAEKGFQHYDLFAGEGGLGAFKRKFGAEPVARVRWYKSFSAMARISSEIYKSLYYSRRKAIRKVREKWKLSGKSVF